MKMHHMIWLTLPGVVVMIGLPCLFSAETLWQEKPGSDAGPIPHFQGQESPFWTYAPKSLMNITDQDRY